MHPIGHLQFLLSIYIVLLHNYCSSTGICQLYNSCYNIMYFIWYAATGCINCIGLLNTIVLYTFVISLYMYKQFGNQVTFSLAHPLTQPPTHPFTHSLTVVVGSSPYGESSRGAGGVCSYKM